MKTSKLREKYLEFFKEKNHTLFSSDTLIPSDESLLFTSAGMNQFKPYFLGEKKDVSRATSCQKCLRTGDLERVGQTDYHHTFFEMLGNFSFGDYFKKEAIEFAWEFLTKKLGIKEKDLWVSVYEDDDEAYSIWKDVIKISEQRIVKLGEESNYWPASAPSKGPNGVCGPCSEIFFDKGKDIGCCREECDPDCSCGRFVEIWNLVFTQFNRVGENKLEPLPQKNIDTGMGLERVAAVLQGKESNFEIDILQPAVDLAKKILKVNQIDQKNKSLVYAIVDHSRAATFAISDGIYPSNEDRGYVIRKIIRKALWAGYQLGRKTPFLYELVDLYAELMAGAFPSDAYSDIRKKKEVIAKVIKAEEEKFLSALDEGQKQFFIVEKRLKDKNKKIISAQDLFYLYDTYGLPLELTKEMAKEANLAVDEKGFSKFLEEQQKRSRKKSMFDENIFKESSLKIKEVSIFVGYEKNEINANLVQLIPVKGREDTGQGDIQDLKNNEEGIVVSDITPFYPESGGQLTDKGKIITKDGEFLIEKVFKVDGAILHKGRVVKGFIRKGEARLIVDKERRLALARAHTATHLLQAALRGVLGEHVVQQGSLVDEDEFRFDFTHFSALTNEEEKKVSNKVKEFIKEAKDVRKEELTLEQAKKEGALAFFKDKYQQKVRVVSIFNYSKELCGGIHVSNTDEVGDFEIESERSISSGIRRIRAVVGEKAQKLRQFQKEKQAQKNEEAKESKKISQDEVLKIVAKQEEKLLSEESSVGGNKMINGINFFFNFNDENLFSSQEQSRIIPLLSDRLKQRLNSVFIFIVAKADDKNIFICSATEDLIKRGVSCSQFILELKNELPLTGGGNEKTARGALSNIDDDFAMKVKGAFTQFTS